MRTITYTQTYQRQVVIKVTGEQYDALHGQDAEARYSAEQFVTDKALTELDSQPMEFVMAIATDEDEEELFDRG